MALAIGRRHAHAAAHRARPRGADTRIRFDLDALDQAANIARDEMLVGQLRRPAFAE